MAVVEQITLRASIPSTTEIAELQNTVIKIEDLAERSEAATQQIQKSGRQNRGGIFAGGDSGSLPRNVTRRASSASNSREVDSAMQNAFRNKDKTSAAPFERSNPFKEVQKEILSLKAAQAKTNDALSFLTDFQGTAATKLLGAANKVLPVGFALSIATTVYGLIVAQFGKGGIFDIRKTQLDSVKSFIGLERETDIIGGETLFLGNPTLVQGIPRNTTSNTENLRDGQRRFVLRSNGF